ncbi:MAG: alpha/beta superfamily hydrolase/acyltransferase [uncultured bacterium (gcode 4)]|uniref:Alpha/beta superfamily hydrolase/acyltransferase n=1 Tax=uncultured bacterium (gcode 4) TaxID=1234023 RepID=K2GTE2_9BACT|nr:MAG: alpha/beta superfamily hydrolase/acyltransferase [uncultured bacterium (gcode 4)]
MLEKQSVVDGVIINYLISDNFDPEKCLFFLHWWKQDRKSFISILEILENKKISFISIDFPGFWKSSKLSYDWWIKDFSEITCRFIEKLDLKKPVLIAHSFWWRIAIYLWAKYNIASKLILIWAWSISPKKKNIKYFIVKAGKFLLSVKWLHFIWDIVREKLRSPDYKSSNELKWTFLKIINEDISNMLTDIKAPVLLIWWKNDNQTLLEQWIQMKDTIPNSRLEIFEDWTHFVFQEYPQEVANLITDFTNVS